MAPRSTRLKHGEGWLRSAAIEIVEELKLRRRNDAENEGRLHGLIKEKYDLERKLDNCSTRTVDLKDQHLKETRDVKKRLEEKLQSLAEEVKQHEVHRDCSEREAKALKDEVRNLQLTNYSLEKQLREQEHKLQLQTSSSEQHLDQLSTLEQKCKSLSGLCHEMSESQQQLEKNVSEAVKLNKTLMYVNDHQKCIVEQQKTDITSLRDQVVQLNVKIQSQPVQETTHLKLEQEVVTLNQQILAGELMKETLAKEVGEYREKYQANIESLKDAHSIIERHLQCLQTHKEEADDLKEQLNQKDKLVSELKGGLDQANKDLTVEKSQFTHAVDTWREEEEKLKGNLREVSELLAKATRAQSEVEELNSKWSTENMELHQQVATLRKKLEIEKIDEAMQTVLGMLNTSDEFCQTQIQCQTAQSQTDAQNSRACCTQTDALNPRACYTQTITASYSNSACQTTQTLFLDQEVQTVHIDKPSVDFPSEPHTSKSSTISTQTSNLLDSKNTGIDTSDVDFSLPVVIEHGGMPNPCATSSPNILYATASEELPSQDFEISAIRLEEKNNSEVACVEKPSAKKPRKCFELEADLKSPSSQSNSQEILPKLSNLLDSDEESTHKPYNSAVSATSSKYVSPLSVEEPQHCSPISQVALLNKNHQESQIQQCSQLRMGSSQGFSVNEQTPSSQGFPASSPMASSQGFSVRGRQSVELDGSGGIVCEELQHSVSTPVRMFSRIQVSQESLVKAAHSPHTEIRKRLELVNLSQSDSSSCEPNSTISNFSTTESGLSSDISRSGLLSESSYYTAPSVLSSDSSSTSKTSSKLSLKVHCLTRSETVSRHCAGSNVPVVNPSPQLSPYSHYASLLKKVQPPASRKSLNVELATTISSTCSTAVEIRCTSRKSHAVSEDRSGVMTRKKSILRDRRNIKGKTLGKSVRFAEDTAKTDHKDSNSKGVKPTTGTVPKQVSGDQPLFSDGEEDNFELGSQFKGLEEILQRDRNSRGKKRKHNDKVE
ncbi:hypothetical protein ScPMuIL_009098 [Solemya velum]